MGTKSQELLLGRNTEYTVERVVGIGGRWHVFGRVVAPATRTAH